MALEKWKNQNRRIAKFKNWPIHLEFGHSLILAICSSLFEIFLALEQVLDSLVVDILYIPFYDHFSLVYHHKNNDYNFHKVRYKKWVQTGPIMIKSVISRRFLNLCFLSANIKLPKMEAVWRRSFSVIASSGWISSLVLIVRQTGRILLWLFFWACIKIFPSHSAIIN